MVGLWSRAVELFVTHLLERIMFVKRLALVAMLLAVLVLSVSSAWATALTPGGVTGFVATGFNQWNNDR